MRFPIISTAKKVRFPKNLCLNKAYTKSFDKNSSLVTKAYKALEYNALQCDELYFQLITPKSPSQGCDEFIQQLITPQQTDWQHVTLHCNEWRVFIKTFYAFCRWLFLILVDSIRLWSWNKLTLTLICHQAAHNIIYFVHSAFSPSFCRIILDIARYGSAKGILLQYERAHFMLQKHTF